jgi:hypothetical protein
MTLTTTINKLAYAGNGSTTSFAFSFKIWAAADLDVYLRDNTTLIDTLQTLTSNYTVSGTLPGTGNVNMVVAPTASQTLIIVRDNSLTQTLDLIANGAFEAENMETAIDKIVGMVQLVDAKLGVTGQATLDFPSVANGAVSAPITITATGARVGDFVSVSSGGTIETTAGVWLVGKVTANDTVSVTLVNFSGGAFDAASQRVFAVCRPRSNIGL